MRAKKCVVFDNKINYKVEFVTHKKNSATNIEPYFIISQKSTKEAIFKVQQQ